MLLWYMAICFQFASTELQKQIARTVLCRNDSNFIGEDIKIITELTRRMSETSQMTIPQFTKPANTSIPEFFDNNGSFLNSSRRHDDRDNDPKEFTLKAKVLDMMRQTLYATQYRMKDIDKLYRKYITSEVFRLAYMYSKVDDWKHDMLVMWTVLSKDRKPHGDEEQRSFRVYKHLIYYNHMLRRDIDITYTIEEIMRIHNKIYASMVSSEKLTE